jgi:hypothetical protein
LPSGRRGSWQPHLPSYGSLPGAASRARVNRAPIHGVRSGPSISWSRGQQPRSQLLGDRRDASATARPFRPPVPGGQSLSQVRRNEHRCNQRLGEDCLNHRSEPSVRTIGPNHRAPFLGPHPSATGDGPSADPMAVAPNSFPQLDTGGSTPAARHQRLDTSSSTPAARPVPAHLPTAATTRRGSADRVRRMRTSSCARPARLAVRSPLPRGPRAAERSAPRGQSRRRSAGDHPGWRTR